MTQGIDDAQREQRGAAQRAAPVAGRRATSRRRGGVPARVEARSITGTVLTVDAGSTA